MSLYSMISSVLSYVFTTIIYLFIFGVMALIYMDIKKANPGEQILEEGNQFLEETCVGFKRNFIKNSIAIFISHRLSVFVNNLYSVTITIEGKTHIST